MLALRRQISRLKLLHKAVHLSSGLKIPDYYNQETNQETSVQSTRSYHPLHYSFILIRINSVFS